MKTTAPHIPFEATHPGILINDELEARGDIKQKELAQLLGINPSQLNEIIKGKRPITADLAILLEKSLEIPADYWMRFQTQYEINCARIKEKNITKLSLIETWNTIKQYVPISYLKKQDYLTESLTENINKIKAIYNVSTISELANRCTSQKFAFYKKSEKLKIDPKNMLAWSCVAEYEAQQQVATTTFNSNTIEELTEKLNVIFFENKNTIYAVQNTLNQYGIKCVVVKKLEKTPVDGYSFWSHNNPAIAVSLRHTRIDNFAFTIMHEIGHIALHLSNNKGQKFLNFDTNEINKYETEANTFAQTSLIATNTWHAINANYSPLSHDKLLAASKCYAIHPAIIKGRASYENNNYTTATAFNSKLN